MSLYGKVRSLVGKTVLALGVDLRLKTPDRHELEQVILPWFAAAPDRNAVLFVGCDWYTRVYAKMFAARDYHTIDYDPKKAFYGSRKHVVGSATDVAKFYPAGTFDVVFFNGVYGYGVNEREPLEQCISGIFTILKPGGVMVVGWDDVPDRSPFPLYDVAALKRFERWTFPPYGDSQRRIPGEYNKIYDFFARPISS